VTWAATAPTATPCVLLIASYLTVGGLVCTPVTSAWTDLAEFGQNYLTATNPHPRQASDIGPTCPYCDTLCFVDRVLPDGRRVRMHTCYFGMDANLAEFGENYLTATNSYLRRAA
jgi:hypothetical protein